MKLKRFLFLCFVLLPFLAQVAFGTDTQNASTELKPSQTRIRINEKQFFNDLFVGQKEIWTSPFRAQTRDLLWIVPLIGGTALTLKNDADWSHSYQPSNSTLDASRKISYLGSGPVTFSTAAAIYFIGKLTNNDRAKSAGFLSLEALANTAILVQGAKAITGRERPKSGDRDGSFWVRGNSFPSGHSASVWSLAAVFAGVYPDNKLIQVGAYSLATAVSISRVTGQNHFVSDALVGSAVGYLIGRMVVKQHTISSNESKLQSITPYIDKKNQRYGLSVLVRW
jgi:membrane-associated phospholipid phosphatase